MRFPGFGISGYRSFWGDVQWIPLGDGVTVVLGGNNAGKSNVLRLLHRHADDLAASARRENMNLKSFDVREDSPRGTTATAVQVTWPIDAGAAIESNRVIQPVLELEYLNRFGTPCLQLGAEHLGDSLQITNEHCVQLQRDHQEVRWRQLSSALTRHSGGAKGADVGRVLGWLKQFFIDLPPVVFVPPSRNLKGGTTSDDWDFGGDGVIDRLHRIRNPEFDEDELRSQAAALTADLGRLLEDDQLEFEVQHDRSTLNIRLGGNFYPLHALGTGTEHAVLILAAHHVFPERLLCLEEPDAHLHPRLQRRLMGLLRQNSERQVVVATHSAHLIDGQTDQVMTARLTGSRTQVETVADHSLFETLRSLGYRASDLLQANAVIWVEGPSDRIYLLHWLSAADPTLIEGVDFSIMFYGGALLTRMSAADQGPDDHTLVDLYRINQRMWVVMDSDREEGKVLKPAVERLQDEITASGRGGTWITEGYTIENYIDPSLLLEAAREVHPSVEDIWSPARNRDPLKRLKRSNGSMLAVVDKVAVAAAVCDREPHLDVLDLRTQVEALVTFLKDSRDDSPMSIVLEDHDET